jgi:hypothetical protein
MRRAATMGLALVLSLAPASFAGAQDDFDDDGFEDAEAEGDLSGEADGETGGEDQASTPAGKRSWFFGPYFRFVFVPAFMLELFLEEAPTVGNAAFGAAATYRTEDGPSFEIGIGYTSYGFDDPFRAKGDPIEDTEYLNSSLGLVHLTGSILWNTPLVEDKLFFEYGVGLDLGIVVGELVRSEARLDAAGNWERCPGPVPGDGGFCEPTRSGLPTDAYDAEGAHYGVVEERVPPVALFPMLPRLGLRYEPIPNELAVKFEVAYGIAQIWLGLSAAYAPAL